MDHRSLSDQIEALANRYDAIAIGTTKRFRAGIRGISIQDITNAQRDALVLHDAARALKTMEAQRDVPK